MSDLNQTLQELPWAGFIVLCLVIATGLILWAAGRRVLRPALAVIGLMVGAGVGLMIGASLGLGVGVYVAAMVCGAVAACIFALGYRLAVAMVTMTLFVIASPMAVMTAAEIQAKRAGRTVAEGEIHNPITDELTAWLDEHGVPATSLPSEAAARSAAESVTDTLARAKTALSKSLGQTEAARVEWIERFGTSLSNSCKQWWEHTPPKIRPTLTLSAVIGGIVGLLLGIVAPSLSASIVTALGGSMLWLTGTRVVALRLGVHDSDWLPASSLGWMALWLITTVAGLVIQWTFRQKQVDRPSPEK
jgi:hypothetical protein